MSFRKLDILFFEMFSFVFFNTHTDSKVFVTKILQPIKEFESERIHEEENIKMKITTLANLSSTVLLLQHVHLSVIREVCIEEQTLHK